MKRGRGRRGATLVEVALAFSLAVGLTVFSLEAFRFFTTRTATTTDEIHKARALGVFVQRLRRVLRFAVKILPENGGVLVVTAELGEDGRPVLRETYIGPDGAGGIQIVGPDGVAHSASLWGADPRVEVLEREGAVEVKVGGGSSSTSAVQRSLYPLDDRLLLREGQQLDLEALRRLLEEEGWVRTAAATSRGPGRTSVPSDSQSFAARPGFVPEPSGPTRNTLATEASVLGVEVSPEGRALLPVKPERGIDRLNAASVTDDLVNRGWSTYDASLLAVLLAGAEFPDRRFRAASLGLFVSKEQDRGARARLDLIADLHPPWRGRVDGNLFATARDSGEYPTAFSGGLLAGAGGGLGAGELPRGFGAEGDDPGDGPEPGWDTWQTVAEGSQVPQDVFVALPDDLQGMVTVDPSDLGNGLPPVVPGQVPPPPPPDPGGGPPGPAPAGDPAADPGAAPSVPVAALPPDPPVGPGPFVSPVEDPTAAEDNSGIEDLIQAAPELQQSAEDFDTATNNAAIREAERQAAQSRFDRALGHWTNAFAAFRDAQTDLSSCQSACAGDPACGCGSQAADAEQARLDLDAWTAELEAAEGELTEAQMASELAELDRAGQREHYDNVSRIIEDGY